jgi:pyruvate dehydrogenase E1 component alpha subunit
MRLWAAFANCGGLAVDQYAKNDNVTICIFGDGATNIGYFHEALNLSKAWGLRVLWVCENNKYGMGTTVERASAVLDIQQKAEGYAMKNSQVDGMDVMKSAMLPRRIEYVYEQPAVSSQRSRTLLRSFDGT